MSVFDGLADIFTATFGQTVTILPDAGASFTVQGIYQSRSTDAFGVVQPEAMLHLTAADAALLADDALVNIGDAWFVPRVSEPDGKGMVPFRLEKTEAPD